MFLFVLTDIAAASYVHADFAPAPYVLAAAPYVHTVAAAAPIAAPYVHQVAAPVQYAAAPVAVAAPQVSSYQIVKFEIISLTS